MFSCFVIVGKTEKKNPKYTIYFKYTNRNLKKKRINKNVVVFFLNFFLLICCIIGINMKNKRNKK